MSTQFPSKNPFLFGSSFVSPFQATEVAASDVALAEGSYEYALVPSGPAVPADECETDANAVEILIKFGASVLHVAHLTPPRTFWIGESNELAKCDCEAPANALGAQRLPIVTVEGGALSLVIPDAATGSLSIGGQRRSLVEVRANAVPSSEIANAKTVALPNGARATLILGGLTIEIAATNAGKKIAASSGVDTKSLPFQGLSLLVHAAVLGACALFMPALGTTDEDGISADQAYTIQAMLNDANAIHEQDPSKDDTADNKDTKDAQGGTGTAAIGESGKMGGESRNTSGRYAVLGDKNNPDPHIASSRSELLNDAGSFGMIAMLNGVKDQPIAPWGRAESWGNDALSANGNMWGSEIGDASGAGGLGLSGIGEGAGGRGEGIGLGLIGTIGSGSGTGLGQGFGPGTGRSSGHLAGVHKVSVPRVRVGVASTSGHLPPEVIQRIVRANFGRFRLCYENGLRTSPNLAGRVSVRFIIGRDGATSSVANGGSDLPDAGVVSCVVRAFYGLSFPAPEAGIVTVSYPISFSPGDA